MNTLRFLLVAFVVGYAESTSIYWNGTCPLVIHSNCPDNEDMSYTLYTSLSGSGEVLDVAANNIGATTFNPANPTKIVIHGFMDSAAGQLTSIKTAYLTKGAYNVIMVDWSFLAQGPQFCYPTAAANLRHVGSCTAKLVQQLRDVSATDIHVVGHSLGAQMSNYIAKSVTPKLPRISGLDPAGPLFTVGTSLLAMLDTSDATFVDVYHTNNLPFGKADRSGHVDFYFNGGILQPGCNLDATCSTYRSVQYFAESITATATKFYGTKCSSLLLYVTGLCPSTPRNVLVGEDALKTTTGVVKVPARAASPYAMG